MLGSSPVTSSCFPPGLQLQEVGGIGFFPPGPQQLFCKITLYFGKILCQRFFLLQEGLLFSIELSEEWAGTVDDSIQVPG